MQQDDAVNAVVRDQHDRVARMPVDHIAQRRESPNENILQRLPTRDRRPVRSTIPSLEEARPAGSDLVRRQPLPLAVIDVDQTTERARREPERGRDRGCSRTGSAERARKDGGGAPSRVDAVRGRLCLPPAFRG